MKSIITYKLVPETKCETICYVKKYSECAQL